MLAHDLEWESCPDISTSTHPTQVHGYFITIGDKAREAGFAQAKAHTEPHVAWFKVHGITPASIDWGVGFVAGHPDEERPNVMACTLSHVKAMRQMLLDGVDVALVAEDDAHFHTDFSCRLNASINWLLRAEMVDATAPKIMMLGATCCGEMPFSRSAASRVLGRVPSGLQIYGAFAYIVTREGARKIVEMFGDGGLATTKQRLNTSGFAGVPMTADWLLYGICGGRSLLWPPIAVEACGPSTIDASIGRSNTHLRATWACQARGEYALRDFVGWHNTRAFTLLLRKEKTLVVEVRFGHNDDTCESSRAGVGAAALTSADPKIIWREAVCAGGLASATRGSQEELARGTRWLAGIVHEALSHAAPHEEFQSVFICGAEFTVNNIVEFERTVMTSIQELDGCLPWNTMLFPSDTSEDAAPSAVFLRGDMFSSIRQQRDRGFALHARSRCTVIPASCVSGSALFCRDTPTDGVVFLDPSLERREYYDAFLTDRDTFALVMPLSPRSEDLPRIVEFRGRRMMCASSSHSTTYFDPEILQADILAGSETQFEVRIDGCATLVTLSRFDEVHDKIRNKVVLAAVMRNEDAVVGAWIEHHARLGVDHFIIYDNGGETSTMRETLAPFGSLVTRIVWPFASKHPWSLGVPEQHGANNHCLHAFSSCAYIGFFDVDEFVNPGKTTISLRSILDSLCASRDLCAAVLTVGREFYNPSLADETNNNFLRIVDCGEAYVSRKIFCVPAVTLACGLSVNIHNIHNGDSKTVVAETDTLVHNHYRFLNKKDRGRAVGMGGARDDSMLKHVRT